MHIEIIAVGNSKGIRIPKSILEQCGFGDKAELHVADGKLIVTPRRAPREGWIEAMEAAEITPEDGLLDPETPTDFDESEWTW